MHIHIHVHVHTDGTRHMAVSNRGEIYSDAARSWKLLANVVSDTLQNFIKSSCIEMDDVLNLPWHFNWQTG